MPKLQSLKKPLSALMATSLIIMSVPSFGLAADGSSCATCPEKPTAYETQKVIEQEVSVKTTGNSITIPAGTSLQLQGIGACPTTVGNNFRGQVTSPVVVNGMTILPAGSEVTGEVTAINTSTNTMQIDLRNVSTPTGESIPLRGKANVARLGTTTPVTTTTQYQTVQTPQGVQYVAAGQPVYGGVQVNAGDAGLSMPYLRFGRGQITPAQKIIGGTLGGALFGGAVGTLSGLVMPSVYDNDINYSNGTGAVRGLAWGAIMGAGLGLVTGLIAAAADRDDCCVTSTTTCPVPVATCPAPAVVPVANTCPDEACLYTNLTTGSVQQTTVQETTVAYPTATTTVIQPAQYNLILEDSITIIKR